MTDIKAPPMTEQSVRELLEQAGVGMGLHVVARQFNYSDPWEAQGRVNDMVDLMLLREGRYSERPRGYGYFQGCDEECCIDEEGLQEIIPMMKGLNPKLYELQKQRERPPSIPPAK